MEFQLRTGVQTINNLFPGCSKIFKLKKNSVNIFIFEKNLNKAQFFFNDEQECWDFFFRTRCRGIKCF